MLSSLTLRTPPNSCATRFLCSQVARNMEEAANCYERAAEQFEITKSAHESARAYVEAAKCRKTNAPKTAVDAFEKVCVCVHWFGLYQRDLVETACIVVGCDRAARSKMSC